MLGFKNKQWEDSADHITISKHMVRCMETMYKNSNYTEEGVDLVDVGLSPTTKELQSLLVETVEVSVVFPITMRWVSTLSREASLRTLSQISGNALTTGKQYPTTEGVLVYRFRNSDKDMVFVTPDGEYTQFNLSKYLTPRMLKPLCKALVKACKRTLERQDEDTVLYFGVVDSDIFPPNTEVISQIPSSDLVKYVTRMVTHPPRVNARMFSLLTGNEAFKVNEEDFSVYCLFRLLSQIRFYYKFAIPIEEGPSANVGHYDPAR